MRGSLSPGGLTRESECRACGCHPAGSQSLQCDSAGQCPCKAGVGGRQCNACLPLHHSFPGLPAQPGCQECSCLAAGTEGNTAQCDPSNGACPCKQNVEGEQCDTCKPGHFQANL